MPPEVLLHRPNVLSLKSARRLPMIPPLACTAHGAPSVDPANGVVMAVVRLAPPITVACNVRRQNRDLPLPSIVAPCGCDPGRSASHKRTIFGEVGSPEEGGGGREVNPMEKLPPLKLIPTDLLLACKPRGTPPSRRLPGGAAASSSKLLKAGQAPLE